ncbi:MAG: M48 family metalloprotease [Chlamydiales bacterium]
MLHASSVCNVVLSYVAEPYNAVKEGLHYLQCDNHFSAPVKKEVSSKVDQLIRPFLKEIVGEDRTKMVHLFRGKPTDSFAKAAGSFRCGFTVIYLKDRFIKKIVKNFEPKHKFFIAHELAHLVNDDLFDIAELKLGVSPFVRILSYCISIVALTIFLPVGFIGTHLIGCGISKAANFCYLKYVEHVQRTKEMSADLFAAKVSPEIAKGGLDANKKTLKRKTGRLERKIEEARTSSSTNSLIKMFREFGLRISYTNQGEKRFHFSHPYFTTRIKAIEPYVLPIELHL